MISVGVETNPVDIEKLNAAFVRYLAYYKGNTKKTIEKTCVQLIKSLAGSTKVSAKIRPIVKNPDQRAKTDLRMARYGVYKYYGGQKKFSPLRGTGEYGKIRYKDKKTLQFMEWDKATGKRRVIEMNQADLMIEGKTDLAMQNHPKRKIKRSGLAKASWKWLLGRLGASSKADHSEITGTVAKTEFTREGGTSVFGIELVNKLNYIRKSLHGSQPLSSLLSRTVSQMRVDMGEIPKGAKKAAGLS